MIYCNEKDRNSIKTQSFGRAAKKPSFRVTNIQASPEPGYYSLFFSRILGSTLLLCTHACTLMYQVIIFQDGILFICY